MESPLVARRSPVEGKLPPTVVDKHTGLWSRLKAPEPVTLVRIQAGLPAFTKQSSFLLL